MNEQIHERYPALMTIAEDSTDFPYVTKAVKDGGLGFDYKWDMGWMNDTLKYFKEDPVYRQYDHNLLTFSATSIVSSYFCFIKDLLICLSTSYFSRSSLALMSFSSKSNSTSRSPIS